MSDQLFSQMRIGCSGYYYPQWKEHFYPAGLPASKWLGYYSSVFNTVELNGTFYRIPKITDLQKNAAATPAGFTFSVKVSRYITHITRLRDTASKIREFIDVIQEGLSGKLDKLLFQLPPSFLYTAENLALILHNIPPSQQHVIEFRHSSWWNDQVETTLKRSGYTFCNVSYPGLPTDLIQTSPSFYLRMHGVPDLFKSAYTSEELDSWHKKIPPGCTSYHIYFNNTYYDAAYRNALALIQMNTQA